MIDNLWSKHWFCCIQVINLMCVRNIFYRTIILAFLFPQIVINRRMCNYDFCRFFVCSMENKSLAFPNLLLIHKLKDIQVFY